MRPGSGEPRPRTLRILGREHAWLLLALAIPAGLLVLGAASNLRASSNAGSGGTRPNVLVISIDTLRADHLSSLGYGRPTSPVIDAIAAEGLLS